jgi:hypothetical protein
VKLMPKRARRCLAATAALIAASFVTGCSRIDVISGVPPRLDMLDAELKLGQSDPDAVRAALGKPSGEGAILLPMDPRRRELWIYTHGVGSVTMQSRQSPPTMQSRLTYLLVYFADGRYDGYMWFSSLHDPP